MIGKVVDFSSNSANRGQWKPGGITFMNRAPGSTYAVLKSGFRDECTGRT
ncbi:MAG: hypothetical protein K6T94_22990 [Paenibacillus sp.]|nr:hypothetical protein [Paenibacillus sp.]